MTDATKGNRESLLAELRSCRNDDTESGHIRADAALLDFIGDAEITAAFDAIEKWYA